MKFPILYLVFFLLILGCEKINDLINFNIKNETEVIIPSQSGISIPFVVRSPEVKTSSEQTFKNNNTRADLVQSAYLSQLVLSIISPENQNFDFLNEISIYIKNSEGKEELVAFKANIPEDGSRILALEPTNTDLKPYVKDDSYSIRTDIKTDQVLTEEVKIKIDMTFKVKAKIL